MQPPEPRPGGLPSSLISVVDEGTVSTMRHNEAHVRHPPGERPPQPGITRPGTLGAQVGFPRNLEGSLMREAVRWPIRGVSLIRSSRLALCGS
jgi:hypothetical protein